MAHWGKHMRLLVGAAGWAHDFSGVTNELGVSLNGERLDTTAMQNTGRTSIAGDASGTLTQNGYAVLAADESQNLEDYLSDALAAGTDLTVAVLTMTTIDACPAYVARATNPSSIETAGAAAGLMTLQGEWPQGIGIVRGKRVWQGTIAATGAQSSPAHVDLGAAGAAGGYAWLFVRAITGTATNASILLQSDDNTGFSSPATEATFTVSSTGAYEVALTGAVDRYLRLSTSSLGGATNLTVTAIAAVAGVTF